MNIVIAWALKTQHLLSSIYIIYSEDFDFYDFNCQKAFRVKYITKNFLASQKYYKYDENNIKYKGNILAKS